MGQELALDGSRAAQGFVTAETMLRALHGHSADEPIGWISALIHPEAEMRLLITYGEVVRGRGAIAQVLHEGREAAMYRARVERFEWLDHDTSLTVGLARFPLRSGGFGEGRVYWLDELRDGLIWRVSAFRREDDARQAYVDGRYRPA